MKKKLLLFIAVLFIVTCYTQKAGAEIWRVNNHSNYNGSNLYGDNFGGTAAKPVFAQINQAVAFGIVNDGDTIHVEGSTDNYTGATISKKLVIIGTGYFLTNNPKTNSNTLETRVRFFTFNANSQGSQVIGIRIVHGGNTADGIVYVNVSGITIKRCLIEQTVEFGFLLSDVYILENFFPNTSISNAISTNGNTTFTPPTDIIFNNNICQKTLTWGSPLANPTTLWPILQCNNNVFDGPDNLATPNLAFSTSEFKNNILMPTNAKVNIAASAGVIAYNIGTLSTQFGTADNNLVVPAITSLFVSSASTDGAYQIANASQAGNNGSDGTDRGAFGGSAVTSRYTLSGLAAIPVVYEITTPGATSTNLPVTISARTIK
ncbi:MAG: hypothetical protein ABI472_02980 [Ginsengibacter sp.]